MDPDSRVQLAEIRGDIKLILAGQDRQSTDIHAIRTTLDRHDRRLVSLEKRDAERDAERKGIALTTRVMWAVMGALPTGAIVALLMRALS
jgi:cob(I)alamin adenosyltransferase